MTATLKPVEPREEKLSDILDGTEVPVAYKIGYILNSYREPSFRAIEADLGLTRPEIVLLLALLFQKSTPKRKQTKTIRSDPSASPL